MKAVLATPGIWGIDTNSKITQKICNELKAAAYSDNGTDRKIEFIIRYVSLGSPSPFDITADEANLIVSNGFLLGLVQHPKYPGWLINGPIGTALGRNAANHASSISYPERCMLAFDDEGTNSTGPDVSSGIINWAQQCEAFQPVLYVGYQCGLTPDQLWSIPNMHLYWSDFGPRVVPHRGFAMKQVTNTISLPGVSIPVDMDRIQEDDMKGLPWLAAA